MEPSKRPKRPQHRRRFDDWHLRGGHLTWGALRYLGKGIKRKISQDDLDILFFAAGDLHEVAVRLAKNGCEHEARTASRAAGAAMKALQLLGLLPLDRKRACLRIYQFCCAREGISTEVSPQGDAALPPLPEFLPHALPASPAPEPGA